MGCGVVAHLKHGSSLLQGLLCAFSWTSLLLILLHLSYLKAIGERQGAPSGKGVFHNEVFTDRILGRLCEAWPCHRVTRGIAPP